MRSVPPAEFAREAAALSPSKSFSNFRTERMVQAVNRQIAIRGNRKRLILPAPRLWAVAMRLSSRQRSDCCRIGMLHHRLAFRQGFLLALARAKGRSHSKQLFDRETKQLQNRKLPLLSR